MEFGGLWFVFMRLKMIEMGFSATKKVEFVHFGLFLDEGIDTMGEGIDTLTLILAKMPFFGVSWT
ncbi:hypothetical protein PIB30_112151, partial [Stylosanthes scabra]|nr:hypothetical protein [Stylosanthes scabra]